VPGRIALLSPPIGNGNLGDEATVAAVIQALRRRRPADEIYVVCPNPSDTSSRHGVRTRPIASGVSRWRPPAPTAKVRPPGLPPAMHGCTGTILGRLPRIARTLRRLSAAPRVALRAVRDAWFLASAVHELRGTRALIVTGSGIVSDHFGGPANFPLTLFRWAVAARLAGARVAVLSVGAGPLTSPLSRWLVRSALSLATYCSARDETSRAILQDLLPNRPVPLVPDLAHGLAVTGGRRTLPTDHQVVAVNAFPHFDPRYWPVADAGRYARYLERLGALVAWLLRRRYRVTLFPTQLRADPPVLRELRREVLRFAGEEHDRDLIEPPISTVEDLLACLASADFVVATRFHGILLSLRLGKPVLALSNHHKMTELMNDMEQSDYVLDIDQFTPESAAERFDHLVQNAPAIRAELLARASARQAAVERQYDTVLALLAMPSTGAADAA
jgi:polysaccharide pyruvyl transferase WcaK-like protein